MAGQPPPLGWEDHRAEDGGRLTSQWIRDHVRSERRYLPPGGTGIRKRIMRRVRKATAQRYYQLLTGHAAIGSFLHDRMAEPQRLDLDRCWWCSSGARQSRHYLFIKCRAWALQIRMLWRGIGEDRHWERPRAPALRRLWREEATEAVLKFLESTRVGCRASAETTKLRMDEDRGGRCLGLGGMEGGAGPP